MSAFLGAFLGTIVGFVLFAVFAAFIQNHDRG